METGGEGGKVFLQGGTASMAALEGVLVHMESAEELDAEVATLGGAVEIMNTIPVGVGVDLSTLETISRMNVGMEPLIMVKLLLYCNTGQINGKCEMSCHFNFFRHCIFPLQTHNTFLHVKI